MEQAAAVELGSRLSNNMAHHASHAAGLKRFSERASKEHHHPSSAPLKGCCFSFSSLAMAVLDRLRECHVHIARGLSDEEFSRIEAPFGFTFPPDLKAILRAGLPVGLGFPDWRSGGLKHLRLVFDLPLIGISYEAGRGRFWLRKWGSRPSSTKQAVGKARIALRKAPVLVPLYRQYYVPASPNLAGNPVFFVCRSRVFVCGSDVADFFQNHDFEKMCQAHHDKVPGGFAFLDAVIGLGASSDTETLRDSTNISSSNPSCLRSVHVEPNADDIAAENVSAEQSRQEVCRGDLDGWGRNLDAMARRNSTGAHITKESLDSRHNGDGLNSSFTRADIKVSTRWIEFWSDIASQTENRYESSFDASEASRTVDTTPVLCRSFSSDEGRTGSDYLAVKQHAPIPYWLDRFLDKMAMALRKGGWREGDITEMFDVSTPLDLQDRGKVSLDVHVILEGLALYVNLLSTALRAAGWSSEDVEGAFDVDVCLPCNHVRKKSISKIPRHVAAELEKLRKMA